LSFRKLIS